LRLRKAGADVGIEAFAGQRGRLRAKAALSASLAYFPCSGKRAKSLIS
jgi:hypothetical protein